MPPRKVVKTSQVPIPPKISRAGTRKNVSDNNSTRKNNVKSVLNSPDNKNVTRRRKSIVDENKIILANEVVRRKLDKKLKNCCDEPNGATSKVNTNQTVVKKKVILKRKRLSKSHIVSFDVDQPGKSLSVKKKTKAVIKKNGDDDPKEKEIKLELEKILPKKETIANKSTETPLSAKSPTKLTEKKDLTTPKSVTKRKVCLNRSTPKKRGPKPRLRTSKTINTKGKIKSPVNVKFGSLNSSICKENYSLTVSSELSWTKNISSLASTCVGVSSKDFICVDNKIPIIKLTKIDQKMIKHNNICKTNNVGKLDNNNDTGIVGCEVNDFGDINNVDKTGNVGDNGNNDNVENNDGTNIHRKMIYDSNINEDNDKEQNIVKNVDMIERDVHDHENLIPSTSSSSDTSSFEEVSVNNKSEEEVSVNNENKEEVSVNNKNKDDLRTSMNLLNSLLQNFDHEVINWVGYVVENSNIDMAIPCKLLNRDIFRQEKDIQLYCNKIKNIIRGHTPESDKLFDNESEEEHFDQTFNSNESAVSKNSDDNIKEVDGSLKRESKLSEELVNKSFNQSYSCDQDDTLSLYADSITEIESIKNYTHKFRGHKSDEYVPAPVDSVFKKPEPLIYNPSKIFKPTCVVPENVYKMTSETAVCEKSNADSTSTCRGNDSNFEENVQFYEDRIGDLHGVVKHRHSDSRSQDVKRSFNFKSNSCLSGHSLKPMLGLRSLVFKGACFFNLAYSCKRMYCKFPHVKFNRKEIKSRLTRIDNQTFQEEYTLLRNSTKLRRLYGMCFIEDCIRRKLTRFLIEMVIDFVTNLDLQSLRDVSMSVEVVETVLLYLNDVDLTRCMDMLRHKTKPNQMLCDIFMDVIGKSQNFSRFKSVFIKMADLVVSIGKDVDSEMVTNILERVCILPYEDILSRALLKVIKNTDRNILSNSTAESFKRRLFYGNKILFEEFSKFIEEHAQKIGNPKNPHSSTLSLDTDIVTNKSGYSESNTRYSPDTTNLDVNKVAVEPKLTKTLNVQKLKYFDKLALSTPSGSEVIRSNRNLENWENDYRRQSNFTSSSTRFGREVPLQSRKRRPYQYFHSGIPNKFPRKMGGHHFNSSNRE